MPIVGQFGSLAGFGVFPGGALESIATVTVGSGGASSIEFASIPGGFQHLQIRYLVASSGTDNNFAFRFNGDSGANYTLHELAGNGTSATAGGLTGVGFARVGYWQTGNLTQPYVGIVDILDYTSTSKNTVLRSFNGCDTNGGDGFTRLNSSLWLNTAAVTSVSFFTVKQNLPQHSTAALYGLRAP
jgi:hypothetical protein